MLIRTKRIYRFSERGQALVAVLFVFAYLALVVIALLSYASLTQVQFTRSEQTATQNASIEGAVDAGMVTIDRYPSQPCQSSAAGNTKGSMSFPANQLFPLGQTLTFTVNSCAKNGLTGGALGPQPIPCVICTLTNTHGIDPQGSLQLQGASSNLTADGPIYARDNLTSAGKLTSNATSWSIAKISVTGPDTSSCSGSGICTPPAPFTNATVLPDPLATAPVPVIPPTPPAGESQLALDWNNPGSVCDPTNHHVYSSMTFRKSCILPSGIYFIEGGGMTLVNAGTVVSGTGVTFFYTCSTYTVPGSCPTTGPNACQPSSGLSAGGNSTISITPPTGTATGLQLFEVALFEDPNCAAALSVGGGSNIPGTIYAPAAPVSFSGGAGGSIGVVVVGTLHMQGAGTDGPFGTVISAAAVCPTYDVSAGAVNVAYQSGATQYNGRALIQTQACAANHQLGILNFSYQSTGAVP